MFLDTFLNQYWLLRYYYICINILNKFYIFSFHFNYNFCKFVALKKKKNSIGLINFISVFVLVTLVHEVKLNKNEKWHLGDYAEIK